MAVFCENHKKHTNGGEKLGVQILNIFYDFGEVLQPTESSLKVATLVQ